MFSLVMYHCYIIVFYYYYCCYCDPFDFGVHFQAVLFSKSWKISSSCVLRDYIIPKLDTDTQSIYLAPHRIWAPSVNFRFAQVIIFKVMIFLSCFVQVWANALLHSLDMGSLTVFHLNQLLGKGYRTFFFEK